jgi:hypothetical protein
VLRQARSAAVLFEAGIIVNRSEEAILQTAEYQPDFKLDFGRHKFVLRGETARSFRI